MLPSKEFFRDAASKAGAPFVERDILREYLQTQILKSLSRSSYQGTLSFLGGTALRFGYNLKRFSEDLGFDLIQAGNFSLEELRDELISDLRNLGYSIEGETKTTENIHIIYWKFNKVLQEFGLKVSKDEKFLIKFEIDFAPPKKIETEVLFVNKFEENFPATFNTLPTIYSEKLFAFFLRPYQKGRDFYDLLWFLSNRKLEPNYKVLQGKGFDISDKKKLFAAVGKRLEECNLDQAAKDVRRFLFDPREAEQIKLLPKFIEQLEREL